ncbi:pancreatic triacylglycerol lipase-like isoform X2 [Spodoptera frugiperda]|uniref:Pancreatic triacylglycerol lipase-like isoform X2 n=1 Tax=Spodoptera frugiperda TaxID=7108 RepID=A0A9R0E9C0_SPOFR|nr:pancreatic triacylglycerol lipase-like isoform X2 [Spodoptera frugiperda]
MLKFIIFVAAVAVCYGQTVDVRYTLHNKNGIVSMPGSGAIPNQFEEDAQSTIFLIHGYPGNTVTNFFQLVRNAILEHSNQNVNVIEVDWTRAAGDSYTQASNNMQSVANNLGVFMQQLYTEITNPTRTTTTTKTSTSTTETSTTETSTTETGTQPVKSGLTFHLVGFDLGAHVAGIVGRKLNRGVVRVARITGLNPGRLRSQLSMQRLTANSASYVEVIHTDTLGVLANGIGDRMGDVDFYANGGNNQPGCYSHSCCHDRAFELFAASMINPLLSGRGCNSMSQMNLNLCRGSSLRLGGIELSKDGNGIYRINTSRRFPFY